VRPLPASWLAHIGRLPTVGEHVDARRTGVSTGDGLRSPSTWPEGQQSWRVTRGSRYRYSQIDNGGHASPGALTGEAQPASSSPMVMMMVMVVVAVVMMVMSAMVVTPPIHRLDTGLRARVLAFQRLGHFRRG